MKNKKRKKRRSVLAIILRGITALGCLFAVYITGLAIVMFGQEIEIKHLKAQGKIATRFVPTEMRETAAMVRQADWIEVQPALADFQQTVKILVQQREKEIKKLIPQEMVYVRTTVNLQDEQGSLLYTLAEKGSGITVVGFDYVNEAGKVNRYKVQLGDTEGYISPKYVVENYEEAVTAYNEDGNYEVHSERGNTYGGGSADNLDYTSREKPEFESNIMPEECRALYITAWRLEEIDRYIDIAKQSDINAFVVDIQDGASIGYAGEVMQAYSPTSAQYACYTVEEYKSAIDKLKHEGFYVIGRITTFNDTLFVQDHPECGITDNEGKLLELSGAYWPSAYNRYTWQYKVDLALEAAQLMGFNEIQFDYVRFPDLVYEREQAGTIEYDNVYGESKAQAIQRFLMYATDRLHELEVYVGADVFGESAYAYVTAYGQYWPAISNVVDVICAMPYPDHFAETEGWKPWEHPYQTLHNWGDSAASRQAETASPAVVRTWIQAYDAIREPYNEYGAEEVSAQIQGLIDAGLTGGYMTWNGSASIKKYNELISALKAYTAP